MNFDAIQFYRDNNTPYLQEGHKHCQTGWVQTACPFCRGNPGWHLGFNFRDNFYSCWRCGGHSIKEVVKAILGCSWHESARVVRRYRTSLFYAGETKQSGKIRQAKELALPYGCGGLKKPHRKYLKSRNFDPDEIERDWGVMGTGNLGPYKFRIIAPIYQHGKLVSYQGRDWTGKAELKYKACPKEEEVMEHKHCLYGLDVIPGQKAVLVEGIFETWRLGRGSAASFGIKYRREQAKKLRRFDEVFVFYDPDPQAMEQAEKIAGYLSIYKKEVHIIKIKNATMDPAELEQDYARDLMKDLLSGD